MTTLHNAIMNLPCNPPPMCTTHDSKGVYAAGHRDARHAAAELSLGIDLPQEDDAEQITEDWLIAMGFMSTRQYGYVLRDRRMAMCVSLDGSLSLDFDATFGGSFGTYDKFATRGAIRRVASAIGFQTFGVPLDGPRFTRAQRQKMHELQLRETWER